ncbi:hypothetical protein [Rhizobacter fulvus]
MTTAVPIDPRRRVEMFGCLAEMIGGFAQLGAGPAALTHEDLNRQMRAGTVFKLTASVGHAGPMDVLIQSVQIDGSVFDVVQIEAPLRDAPFVFQP